MDQSLDIDIRRQCLLKCLIMYLCEDASCLIKEYQADQREEATVSDLRIVLLGKSMSDNRHVANFILERDGPESKTSVTMKLQQCSQRIEGRLNHRYVMLINSPQLLQPNLSLHQITQTVRECVSLSDPGPHVFIIVLHLKDFTDEDRYRVKGVLKEFSEEAIKRTIVLTTDDKTHGSVFSYFSKNTAVNLLIAECGGGHLQLNEKKTGWRSDILKRVEEILKGKKETYLTCTIYEDVKRTSEDKEEKKSEEENYESSYEKDLKEISHEESTHASGQQKLNLVLCGSNATHTVSVSKLLCHSSQTDGTEECVKKQKSHGRQISLVNLPALSRLSEEEVMHHTLRCVSLSDPGVHAFLIIVPVGPLTVEDKAEIEKILKIFDSRDHVILLFTKKPTDDGIATDLVDIYPDCQELISLCGSQYRVIGLKEHEESRQIPELLEYIEKMETEPYSPQICVEAQENRVRRELEEKHKKEIEQLESKIKELESKIPSEEDLQCLRIVLIGRTGNGKSATGNTILGKEEFCSQSNTDSVTTVCEKRVGEVDGRSVAVVDTPGLFDTTLKNEVVVEEIVKCVSLSAPGPHVFVIVLSLGRLTKEETDTIDLIKKIFGTKAAQFSIVLFTRGDDLGDESIEDYVKRSKSADLKKLIRDCGNRFLAFNNREKQDKTQVRKLLKMIKEVRNNNQGGYFTNDMFEEAEMSIKKKMEEILKEREREIQKQKEELQAKHEMEMKKLEEEKQRAEEKMENQLKEKEKKLREEFEEKEKTDQKQREIENQKRLEEEKQQRAEYDQRIEEMKREIDNQRSQYEQQRKEREEEDRKREEKYRQDQDKMRNEQGRIIDELKIKQEDETKKRDLEEKRRNEEEEKERQRWKIKIKEAENDREEIQENIRQQMREWEDEKKQQMREREEEERKRKEKHEEQLREKQEELEKMRKRFEGEREEERQKMEEERQKQRREREEKEREYEEKRQETKRHYEELERERKEEWERRKQEYEERREEERTKWKRMNEDLKREQEEEKGRREAEEKERQKREEKERDEMKQKHEEEIKEIQKKHEEEARKQAEESNDFREKKEQLIQELQQMLEEHQKQYQLLEKLYQHFKDQKSEEVKELKREIEDLKKKTCILM